ncbi:DNA repair protein RAD51 homolog 4 isoform X4 [Andrographis paniculata]|uniref:DNA repair protein RAD51 homolog 4 isoform X4 n=1 Tax=Andrographis paniculata TaxID=175694 RepID=UPI0021E80F45|nr:DNA repair protein RAD51 homolog 4 isoform X4 [Andrographis paniculata]
MQKSMTTFLRYGRRKYQLFFMKERQHRPLLNGIELLKDARQNKCKVSTGCERIDALLEGGLCEGHVTELVGPSSSGKTQVCLKSASHVARNYSGTVMYFDSGNSFSAKRISHFLKQQPLDPSNAEGDKVLQQIQRQVRMLIIDSLSSLIAPVLGGGGPHGHALMVTTGFLLKEIAHEHNISILVTNHTVAGEGGSSKPALGESWKSIPHVRLLLSPHDATSNSCVSILKHPFLASTSCHSQCRDRQALYEASSCSESHPTY